MPAYTPKPPETILEKLNALGLVLAVSDGRLVVRYGQEALTAPQAAWLQAHEPAVLAAIQASDSVTCPRCQKVYDPGADPEARYGEFVDGILCGSCVRDIREITGEEP